MTVVHDRPIDYPALSIYIRSALAERDWGRFVERYGLPPCTLISPPDATPEQAEEFRRAAEAAADGLSMSLPSGSQVSFAAEARGVNPFLEFVQHQQKQVVLLATGGTLTSLAESGTGTLAGNAQMDVWREIVRRDAELIGNALHRSIAIPYLRRMFPGQPVAAEFSLGRDAEPTPGEMFELAGKAVAAGYRISRDELSEATGYTLEDAQTGQPEMGGFGGFAANAEDGCFGGRCKPVANPLQNARNDLDGENTAEDARSPQSANFGDSRLGDAERAFSEDLAAVRNAISGILSSNDLVGAAKGLKKKIPDMMPEKSALAGVIQDAMIDGVASEIVDSGSLSKNSANVVNDNYIEIDDVIFDGDEGFDPLYDVLMNSNRGCEAKVKSDCRVHGNKSPTEEQIARDEEIKKRAANPELISLDDANSYIDNFFSVTDPDGNKVLFASLFKKHLNNKKRGKGENDLRKRYLLYYVNLVSKTVPKENAHKKARPGGVYYFGEVNGARFIVLANYRSHGFFEAYSTHDREPDSARGKSRNPSKLKQKKSIQKKTRHTALTV